MRIQDSPRPEVQNSIPVRLQRGIIFVPVLPRLEIAHKAVAAIQNQENTVRAVAGRGDSLAIDTNAATGQSSHQS